MGLNRNTFRLATFGLLLLTAPVPAQSQAPEALLREAVNQLRGPAMVATYTLTVERPGRSKVYVLRVFTESGRRALIRVIEPKREAGQAFLMLGEEIWIYSPRLGRVLPLPPGGKSDRFLGSDVSYADLAGRDLEDGYEVRLQPAADSGRPVLVLTPKPRAPTPWGRVVLQIEAVRKLPRRIVYYDQRGQPVKEIVMRKVARIAEGRYLVTNTLVIDRVREGYRTVFEVSDWRIGAVPDRCFAPTALERGCER